MDKLNLLKIIEKSLYSLISYSAQTVTKRTINELEKMLENEKNNDIAHSQLELMLKNFMMQDVLAARKNILGKQVHQAAMRSMDNGKPDNQLMAQWVANFLLTN